MEAYDTRLPEPHPEEEALREELARLRASLTALLLQKDDLLLIQCRRIEAAYLRRFGALELKIYESWCDCLRAKRKARLIRASRNRREQADEACVEAALDEEMAQYNEELQTRFRRVERAMERGGGPGLTARGARELRELYRRAVKALHPDLHPEGGEERARALDQAMRAYRAGDLSTLRALCETLEPQPEAGGSDLDALRAEVKRLRSRIREFDRQLDEIKASFPYNARIYLEDEERGRAKQQELERQLRTLRERKAQYDAAIAQMRREDGEEA